MPANNTNANAAANQQAHESDSFEVDIINGSPPPYPLGGDADDDNETEPEGPSLFEQWQMIADSGDVRGVIGLMHKASLGLIDLARVQDLLRHAINVLVRKNPDAFVELVSTDMLGITGALVLRGEFYVQQLMADQDLAYKHRRRWEPSRDLDEFLPGFMALQLHFAELVKVLASAKRLGELARQNEKANKAPARKRRTQSTRRKPRTPSRIRKRPRRQSG